MFMKLNFFFFWQNTIFNINCEEQLIVYEFYSDIRFHFEISFNQIQTFLLRMVRPSYVFQIHLSPFLLHCSSWNFCDVVYAVSAAFQAILNYLPFLFSLTPWFLYICMSYWTFNTRCKSSTSFHVPKF